jgi:outer membrane PBP1 activator LpoA protein
MHPPLPGRTFALCAARALAGIGFAAAAAFCAAQAPAASDAAPVPTPVPVTEPAATKPPADASAAPAAAAGAIVALVLPLDAADYARAAEAVRAGFLAAAEAAGAKSDVVVIAHGDDDVLSAFDKARAAGARVIVGPLVRDHLKIVAASDAPLPWTIALNQLDEGATLPPRVYTLALAIESDARVIARRARDDGVMTIGVIGGDTPLMKRFATAFAGEWLLVGGDAPLSFRFDATPDGLTALRRNLARVKLDAVVIAAEGPDAALVKSFIPRLTAYASAQINQRQTAANLRDLDDVRLVDLPWLITPEAPEFANIPRREFPSAALDRLYALGLDAYRVARVFAAGAPDRLDLEGATGHVTLIEGRQLAREGRLGVFKSGRIVPLDAVR